MLTIRRCTAATCLLLVALTNPPTLSAANSGCERPRGYRVKARTLEAVVYTNLRAGRAYGCLFSVGRRVRIPLARRYTLNGRYVATVGSSVDGDGSQYVAVRVHNLASGRLRRAAVAYRNPISGYEGSSLVTDIALKRNSSVAWIACEAPDRTRCAVDAEFPYQVWRLDRSGRAMLDQGADIRPKSLRLKCNSITWRHGDETRTATLR